MSAGLYNDHPVTKEQIQKADITVVMEEGHRTELSKRFPKEYIKKRILSLGIPDIYYYNQPELKEMLRKKVDELVQPFVELA